MKIIKNMKQDVPYIDTILCNQCGEKIWNTTMKKEEKSDFLSVEKCWGYFTPFDLEMHRFDLCVSCYSKLIKSFKVPIKIGEYEL